MTQPSALTEHQLATARALIATGKSQASVARGLGLTGPTLCRWLNQGAPTGRAEAAEPVHTLTALERETLKRLRLQTGSRRLAAEDFMYLPECEPETALILQDVMAKAKGKGAKPVWPTWFLRETILTDEERFLFRGPKAGQNIEPARARGAFYEVIENGQVVRKDLFANALWESDDQSENTPSLSIDPATGKPQLNRQTLYTVDSYSAFILGFSAIQRVKDAYTLEDQADHALELVDAHGLPLAWRIERGPWDNSFWFGISLPREWWQTQSCASYRWGGLDLSAGGPIAVLQAKKSREKGLIEGTFNHLQNINGHTSRDIGRSRGEHEKAAKMATKVQSLKNRIAPLTEEETAKLSEMFPDAWHRAELSLGGVERFNHEAKQRRMHGNRMLVPADLYREASRRDLTAEERWRFLPVKRAVTVRTATLSFSVSQHEQRVFDFAVEGFQPAWDWHGYLPTGWQVLCAFHPMRPDLGCHVFNGVHPDDPRNPARFPIGQFLGVAPAASLAPQFRLGGAAAFEEDPFKARKAHMKTLRRETRILRADEARPVRSSLLSTGGDVSQNRTGAPDPLAALSAEPTAAAVQADAEAPRSCERSYETFDDGAARNRPSELMTRGERSGRAAQDPEARPNNSAGRAVVDLDFLARQERELMESEGIFT
jgi:hypothetical protein